MDKPYVLGIDEGTSRVKVLIVDRDANTVGFGSAETPTVLPAAGYVEQDPLLLWNITHDLMVRTLSDCGVSPEQIAAIGIANQRDTTILWNRRTGTPYGNAVVWLDKRALAMCDRLRETISHDEVVDRVGFYVIPNASAVLVRWLLDNNPDVKRAVQDSEVCFGTVNSWLLWKLTGGRVHCCDMANMSVTLLQDARRLCYDDHVIEHLQIPRDVLPKLKATDEVYGTTHEGLLSGATIPIAGMLGDQMAATLGQGCVKQGMVKSTYGTGCFSTLNVGARYVPPINGLFSPLLWGNRQSPTYGLEGFSEVCGLAVDWLADNMKLIDNPVETERIVRSLDRDAEPLYFVPAFRGLGTPHLDTRARGALFGITAETTAAHFVKAVLDGIVYQTTDTIKAMENATGQPIGSLRVDGGVAKNDYVCQFQADLLGRPVERPVATESTALGAVYQAGLAVGFWHSLEIIASLWKLDRRFEPQCTQQRSHELYSGWLRAVQRSKGWIEGD